jgi:hypothetical protein
MLGFGHMESAQRFCSAFEELRHYLRIRPPFGGQVSLSERRRTFLARWQSLVTELAVAKSLRITEPRPISAACQHLRPEF